MPSPIFLCALLAIAALCSAPVGADNTVCGKGGLSGGSGSVAGLNNVAVVTSFTSTLSSGSLSIGSDTAHIDASQQGAANIFVKGSLSTNCTCGGYGNSIGSVALYRTDGNYAVWSFSSCAGLNKPFGGATVDFLAPNGIYEFRVSAGGTANFYGVCYTSVTGLYVTVEQPICF